MDLPEELLNMAAKSVLNSGLPEARAGLSARGLAQWGDERWQAAVRRARQLDDESYSLCDRCRNGEFHEREVRPRLRKACPGFGPAAYDDAYESGMRAT